MFDAVYTADVPHTTNRELFAWNDADALTALSGGTDALTRADLRQNLEDVAQRLTPYTAGGLLLTDDRAPVELLGIQVIDSLIQDEVSYYRDLYEREGLQGVVESLL